MQFADLIAPIAVPDFLAQHWDRAPLHIAATDARRATPPLSWDDLNALFAQQSLWTPDRLKLVMHSRPVDPAHYLIEPAGKPQVGDPARIEHLLAIGASMVLDHLEDLLPRARAHADMLADQFGGVVGANAYASFQGVQAFASHYDTHEVFAVQCAGQKKWRIYANRAEAPLNVPQGDGAQQWIDEAKGPVMMEVMTRRGDVLYIPRGFFHDAIATDTASLHLTFGVAPYSGRLLFGLLEQLALADPAFRAWLPDARVNSGSELLGALADLGDRLAALTRTSALRDAVALAQRKVMQPAHAVALPTRPTSQFYARTDRAAHVVREPGGAALVIDALPEPLGLCADLAEWMLQRPAFSVREAHAQFAWHPPIEVDALIERFVRHGLIRRFQPGS
ncbi:MAG: cupin [Alphaproteobacteria bacterium HGW-Alphaproteobacteria-16]|nr:MAG: cupin [Alphaproteobacteria bacterium HGW-Alphaproteobacteria-16]